MEPKRSANERSRGSSIGLRHALQVVRRLRTASNNIRASQVSSRSPPKLRRTNPTTINTPSSYRSSHSSSHMSMGIRQRSPASKFRNFQRFQARSMQKCQGCTGPTVLRTDPRDHIRVQTQDVQRLYRPSGRALVHARLQNSRELKAKLEA